MKIKLLLLCFMFTVFLFAQEITVKGVVKSGSESLPGVSIQVKNTKKGTITDFNGKYTIKTSLKDILIFSFMGYHTKEIVVTQSLLNVSLEEDANLLDEVVVTSFGIKKKEKSLGYSVQKVSANDISMSGKANALEALQGQVSGLIINKSSGSAASGLDILIRGVTSVDPNRNNQPLMIIDGVVINNDTFEGNVLPSAGSGATRSGEQFSFSSRGMDINPDDVESYSILKGAAATALYGEKASNGAIVITTKKGKIGKAKISISSSVTVKSVRKMPEFQTTFREGHVNSKNPGGIRNPNSPTGYDKYGFSFWSWGPKFSENSWDYGNGEIVDLTNDRFYNPYKDFFNVGVNRQINFSISGASDKINYYFSFGDSKDDGIVPNTDYEKINFRFKGGYQISDNISLNTSVAYTKSGGKRSNGGDKSIFSSLAYWPTTFPVNDYKNEDGTQRNATFGTIDNPRYFAEMSNLKDDVNRWLGNLEFNWNPKEWFSIVYRAQLDNYSEHRNRFVPRDLDVGTKVGGFIVEENINFSGLESNLIGTVTKKINDNLNASLMVGHQLRDTRSIYKNVRGEKLNVANINKLSNTTNIFATDNIVVERNMGVFGDLRLEYKDKLFLSITGRNDWNSTLPAHNRSFFYPSVSMSYVFSEDLFKENKVFSFGKIRASWAKVGKGTSPGKVGYYFIPDENFPFNGSGGFRADVSVGDNNLKPEINNNYEIGADLRFLNNKLRVDYSYYNSVINDQIIPVGTAFSSGLSSLIRNSGDYKTWGHELLLSADIIKKENFKWISTVNWSTNKGKVVDLPNDLDGEITFFGDDITSKAKEGDALGSLYGWVFQTAPDGQRYVGADGKWVTTGDKNKGLYYTNNNEMVKVGNAFPDYVLSLNNSITWQNFNLSFLIEYKAGGDVYDRGLRNALRNGTLKETEFRDQKRVLEGVMDDGAGGFTKNTKELLITASSFYRDFKSYNRASEILLQDGSWVKLRNVSLSYDFDKSLLSKLKINRASITFGVSNILIWTPFRGFDPESSQFSAGSNIYGYTGLNVPLTEDYSLGLKFEF